ncbi:MAG: accessory Sec system protein Asp1, partial [Streptococcus salivarius]
FKEEVEHLISEKLNKKKFKHIKDNQSAENYLAENEEVEYRYDFVNLIDETALIKEFEYTRLIVDLSLEPHRYTQIAGISAGIPQINRVTSDYVTHLKNGYILEEVTQFEEAASYYLDQLKYWNQALIEAIEKIRENTGERFVEKWEHYLKEDKYV